MMVHFEKTGELCVRNEVTEWHQEHGWIWNVRDDGGRLLGVFYCTLLCGDGCVIHFETLGGVPRWAFAAAIRKAVRMLEPVCGVIYATIPSRFGKLIAVMRRYGFRVVEGGGFRRDGDAVELLKYFGDEGRYITGNGGAK